MWNWRLDLAGIAKPGKTCRLMGMGTGLAHQESTRHVFRWVWNRTDPFCRSKPRTCCHHLMDAVSQICHSQVSGIVSLASGRCESVRNPQTNLPGTPVDFTSAPNSFHIPPCPPGDKQSPFRLCKSNVRYSWKHLQRWRNLQKATRFDL